MSVEVIESRFMDATYTTMPGHEDPSIPDPDTSDFVSLMDSEDTHNLHLNSPPTVPSISAESAGLSAASSLPVALASAPALSPLPKADASPSPVLSRAKPLTTVKRVVSKNSDGKYQCSWEGCTEDVRTFSRRCEWKKHMDKHERPYKCIEKVCETLPGFTYPGGLNRHEREVHGLHGGPKNPLQCPHTNCKRHTGKNFSRQENLIEHLRRVHTTSPDNTTTATSHDAPDDGQATGDSVSAGHFMGEKKRRRSAYDERDGCTSINVVEELRKLRHENQELKKQIDAQNRQTVAMMNQVAELQAALKTSMAPTAEI